MQDPDGMSSQISVPDTAKESHLTEKVDSKVIQDLIKDVIELKALTYRESATIERIEKRYTQYSGPIPPPDILRGHEAVLPGSADRVLKMAERQLEHRIAMENKQLDHSIKSETKLINTESSLSYLGLIAGFLIAAFGLSGAIYLGLKDKPVASGIMSGGTLAGLVSVFISGKSIIQKQPQNNNDLGGE